MRSIIRNAAAAAALAVVGLTSVPALSIDYPNVDTFWNIQKHFGVVPKFFKLFPEGRLPAMWTQYKDVHLNPDTALDAKTKRLIALAVAAEADCASCIYFQASAAFANGASFQEVQEAVAIFAIEHDWSEILTGESRDAEVGFNRGEVPIDQIFQMVKRDVDTLRSIGTLLEVPVPQEPMYPTATYPAEAY